MNLASIRDQESNVTKAQDLEKLGPQRFRTNILGESFPHIYIPHYIVDLTG